MITDFRNEIILRCENRITYLYNECTRSDIRYIEAEHLLSDVRYLIELIYDLNNNI
jgi:hypothetical protein